MPKTKTEMTDQEKRYLINSTSTIFKAGTCRMIDTTINAIKAGLDPIEALEHLKVAVMSTKEI